MNDAHVVGGLQRIRDLPGNRQRLVDRHQTVDQPVGKRRSLNQFQDQRLDAAAIFKSVNACDVGVAERCEGAGFTLETCNPLGVTRNQVGEDLECDFSTQPAVPGAVHLAHSAGAKGRDDLVRAEPVADREGHAVRRL